MNGTVSLRFAPSNYRITQAPFDAFNIRGNNEVYAATYRQPLVRNPREEFALSLGYEYQRGQTFLFNDLAVPFGVGPEADGTSRTSVFKFGQEPVAIPKVLGLCDRSLVSVQGYLERLMLLILVPLS